MSPVEYVTDFLKDTSVLVVIAYVLSRGRLLRLLFSQRLTPVEVAVLGVLLGSIGLAVTLLPDVGFRYAANTLFSAFATLVGGPIVGLVVASIVSLSTITTASYRAIETIVSVLVCWPLIGELRRHDSIPMRLLIGLLAGSLAQASRIAIHDCFASVWHLSLVPTASGLLSIPSNGFGVALLLLVVSEARVRAESEERRIDAERQRAEAEHAQALASSAQLAALRARIHPHFLFNVLNSIAELCCTAPERAEAAILSLGQLMRSTLDASAATTIPLRDELALTRAYLKIEQERLGERLNIVWSTEDSCLGVNGIPFSVQSLVENAITHGISGKPDGGTIAITIRSAGNRTVIAISDDGAGISPEARRDIRDSEGPASHALRIVNQQLVSLYGERARLRLFIRAGGGTLAAFALPGNATVENQH